MKNNKLGITNEIELAKCKERITKIKALELFDNEKINDFKIDIFNGLLQIHEYLFFDIYKYAENIRK